ncbi:permease-like cell division protein FtsX [Radiobacillus sp. PE A8.2]|uniref:permease-like cell division protein FtsX n=1 Tax=Radiobacillus sp. PE A8.2 TaxID=3380349 RepID=UPI00388D963B
MKIRTINRHFREGAKNIIRNGWMTLASIGAVTTTLLLVGTFLALILNLNQIANTLEEDVSVKALIDLTANEQQIEELKTEIERIPEVASITFSTKDQELNALIEELGDEGKTWELYEQDNPLNHAYIIKATNPEDTAVVARNVETLANVEDIVYGEDTAQKLFTFNNYARNVGLALIAGLILTAVFLISNTIKITIVARSREIRIMKLVGATNNFIRWPFFVEGMLLGLLGSIIPIIILVSGYRYLDINVELLRQYSFIQILPFNPFAWQLSLLIIGIGTVIGIWGSVMSVRKFLKV